MSMGRQSAKLNGYLSVWMWSDLDRLSGDYNSSKHPELIHIKGNWPFSNFVSHCYWLP